MYRLSVPNDLAIYHNLSKWFHISQLSLQLILWMQWLFLLIYQNEKSFGTHFPHKNVPHLIIHQMTKFQCFMSFLSQDIK